MTRDKQKQVERVARMEWSDFASARTLIARHDGEGDDRGRSRRRRPARNAHAALPPAGAAELHHPSPFSAARRATS